MRVLLASMAAVSAAFGCADSGAALPATSAGGGSAGGAAGATAAASGGSGGLATTTVASTGGGGAAQACDVDGTPGVCIDVDSCTDGVAIPGYCPGPVNIQCCVVSQTRCDPNAEVLPNGGLVEDPGVGACPSGMLRVDLFCIDQFEASLVALDGTEVSPYFNPGMTPVRAVSLQGAVPQAYISGVQAADACAHAGKRLCTDEEWLRACRGPDGTTYPYGDVDEPGVCNDARAVHPAVEYYGTTDPWIYSHLDNACLDQLPDSLDRTGSNTGCVTAEGAFDMMGNLHEWTADPAGTFRGGYYVDTVENGPGCLYATTAHTVTYWDYSTGFRCCADAP